MPSFSNDLLNTETVSDQTNQSSPPLAIHMLNVHRYMPPTSPCIFDRQQGNSLLAYFHLTASQTSKFLTLYFLAYPTSQHPIGHNGSPSTFGLDPNSADSQSF